MVHYSSILILTTALRTLTQPVLYKAGFMQFLREEQHKASLAQRTGHYIWRWY